jgi:selenocysteine lyase/cysteine desulfurase
VWAGHYYAVEVMQRLGVLNSGGLVRIGFVHYNTMDELNRVMTAIDDLGTGAGR